MRGDPGPYMQPDGDSIWVPRTVPYLRARQVAREGMEYGYRLVYVGKSDATLFGFTQDCPCDEHCERTDSEADDFDGALEDRCLVPAWHFRQVEP
jgi:hypothetical protein